MSVVPPILEKCEDEFIVVIIKLSGRPKRLPVKPTHRLIPLIHGPKIPDFGPSRAISFMSLVVFDNFDTSLLIDATVDRIAEIPLAIVGSTF